MSIDSKSMPDIVKSQKSRFSSCLQWIGMEKIRLPIFLEKGDRVETQASAFVNIIKNEAKGIHMSRLYLVLYELIGQKDFTMERVRKTLRAFVKSQQGLSDSAKLTLCWTEMHRRQALLSDYSGWRSYPLELGGELIKDQLNFYLKFSVFYSSTCPCSSALSRQIYQQDFKKEFSDGKLELDKVIQWLGETPVAAPHSQRSRADIKLVLKNSVQSTRFVRFIDKVEDDIKTVVQTIVKREDEQEFARLNGKNAMFVEDALRVIKKSLESFEDIESFEVKTHHFESLHEHDAVGSITSS